MTFLYFCAFQVIRNKKGYIGWINEVHACYTNFLAAQQRILSVVFTEISFRPNFAKRFVNEIYDDCLTFI